MGDLFDGYAPGAPWDEVFDRDGRPHDAAVRLHEVFSQRVDVLYRRVDDDFLDPLHSS